MGMIPKYTKATVQMFGGLTGKRLLVLSLTGVLSMQIAEYTVRSSYGLSFTLFNLAMVYFLSMRDAGNPKSTYAQGIGKFLRYRFLEGKRAYLSLGGLAFRHYLDGYQQEKELKKIAEIRVKRDEQLDETQAERNAADVEKEVLEAISQRHGFDAL